jgi:2-methylcitrate dehydratase PrpD
MAAFANGACAHAFELDSMCQPSVGAHPGANLVSPGLSVAQSRGHSGRELITAFVAGCEVMYRIGDAAHHSSEKLGFHAPSLLGVFGGAVTAGHLMKLDAARMANALGIAGSLCGGLLEFSQSGGGMVKRLHLGRASEAGVTAAVMAREGVTGPAGVLDGKFGFLNVYCRDADAARLTAGLGETWHTLTTTFKSYACHSTAHVAVTALLELQAQHKFTGDEVESIHIIGSEKMASHHNIPEPQDLGTAQYSAPFSLAIAAFRDPRDPNVFCDAALNDAAIRALCRKVTLEASAEVTKNNKLASRVTVRLKDGREFSRDEQFFPGMPQRPLGTGQLWEKYARLTAALPAASAARIFQQFLELESVANIGQLNFTS